MALCTTTQKIHYRGTEKKHDSQGSNGGYQFIFLKGKKGFM